MPRHSNSLIAERFVGWRIPACAALFFIAMAIAANAEEDPRPKPADVRVIDREGRVLLSRGATPLAVLQIRPAGAENSEPAAVLSLEDARKVLAAADAQSAPMPSSGEQDRVLDFPLLGGADKDKLNVLLRARKVSAGARVLLTSSLSGHTIAAARSGWKAPPLELAVQVFSDADNKIPDVLFVDGVREEPHFDKPAKRRARTWSLENKKDFRVRLARSAPADWSVRSRDGSVFLSTLLLPDPREPMQCGAFVIFLGGGPDDGVPELSPLKLDRREVAAREIIEGRVRVYASGSNPFVLTETAVVAEVACPPTPNGEVEIKRLPCYFWEAPPGAPAESEFRFRFAPPGEGLYGVRIAVVAASGQARSDAEPFRAGPPASSGFVKAREGERFFRTDDGRLFVPLAASLPSVANPAGAEHKFPNADELRARFIELARSGCNAARLFISNAGLPLENEKAGQFDPATAELLDEIFRAAQARDIRLIVCLEQAQQINEGSKTHPYFREMGGPLAATPEFFRDVAAKRFYQNRLTYVAARYGAFRSVLAWELMDSVDKSWPILGKDIEDKKLKFNEVDLCRRARRDVLEWASTMALHLKGMDQHGHPVCISTTIDPEKPWLDLERAETLDWVFNASTGPDATAQRDEIGAICKWAAVLREPGRAKKPYSFLNSALPTTLSTVDTAVENVRRHNAFFAALAAGLAAPPCLQQPTAEIQAAGIFAAGLAEIFSVHGKDELRYVDSEIKIPQATLRVIGRAGKAGVAVWIHDGNSTGPAISDAVIPLPGLAEGVYTLAWVDTWSGEVLRSEVYSAPAKKEGQAEPMQLRAPGFRRDVVLMIVPLKN